MVSEVF